MVERLSGRKSPEAQRGEGGAKDRQLTNAEQLQQAKALLGEYRGAMKTAPEIKQALADAYFNPDMEVRNFDDGEVTFSRGGNQWRLHYDKFDAGNEVLSLTRFVTSKDGDIDYRQKISLNTWEEPGATPGSLVRGGEISTEVHHASFDGNQKPETRSNTVSAVVTARGFLQEFLLAGEAPQPQKPPRK